eukprot:Lithocolla_globosa_v1_NODE_5654_length_1205_cov_12.394783.p1 type:complete len:120 gc:universal NODE_5654_length_1205_cov_12.394783:439-80(-)
MFVELPKKAGKLYYELHGSSQPRHRVLFIMGFMTPHLAWEKQIQYFKAESSDIQFCVFDNLGVGHSSPTTGLSSTRFSLPQWLFSKPGFLNLCHRTKKPRPVESFPRAVKCRKCLLNPP